MPKDIKKAAAYFKAGNMEKAEHVLKKVLRQYPDNVQAIQLLIQIALRKKDYDSAIHYLNKAIALNPANTDNYNNLGVLLKGTGKLDEAIEIFRKAIQCNRHSVNSHYNLGNALHMKGELDEAITCYRAVLSMNPGDHEAWNNLGNVLKDGERFDDAVSAYQRALQSNPNFALAYSNLGTAFQDQGEFEKAMKAYQRALEIDPCSLMAYNNIGVALREQGQLDDAILMFQKGIRINPADPEFHWNMAITSLLSGSLAKGWREYEWRFKRRNVIVVERMFTQPRWNGSDIEGRTILLYAEQGMGDTVHFIRYAPLVAEKGAKVVVECQKELMSLVQSVQGVSGVFVKGGTLPEFDVWCPLLSLPLLFSTTFETIPADVPYISVQQEIKQSWKQKVLGDPAGFRVGLVWAGNPKYRHDRIRSCPFALLSRLRDVKGVLLYSLQKGGTIRETESPPGKRDIIDYMEEVRDFADTAALIENLDLVISVDTAVLHVAGAMGKQAWALLPYAPDWRWMLNRSDSPWYPTMKLFRQPAFGDWESVLKQVARELHTEVSSKRL